MTTAPSACAGSDKQLVLELLNKLPEHASLKEIMERIAFVQAVREGGRAADAGKLIAAETVFRDMKSWLAP